MKIVHLAATYWDNWGYQENILASSQSHLGHQVTVIAPAVSISNYSTNVTLSPGCYDINGIRVIRLDFVFNIFNKFYIFKGLLDCLSKEKPDIIMVHGLQMLPILQIIKYKTISTNCQLYADFHSDFSNSAVNYLSKTFLHKVFWKLVILKSLTHINKIYYTRPSVKVFVQDLYSIPEKKLSYLPFGADIKDLDTQERNKIRIKVFKDLNIPNNHFLICSGGKIDKLKKIDVLLRSIQLLNNAKIHLLLFGTFDVSYKQTIDSIIDKTPNLHYVGWKEVREINQYFIASDLAIFTGLHSTLWEQAIGCGTPTVFNFQKDRDYLNVGGNTKFIYSDDPNELKETITDILINGKLLKKMKNVALCNGRLKFSYKTITKQLTESWVSELSMVLKN